MAGAGTIFRGAIADVIGVSPPDNSRRDRRRRLRRVFHRTIDPQYRRRQRHTYFVGRRPHEVAELYAVTENDVRRLDREWLGPPSLDWRGHDARGLQLSRVLLARVTGITPPREVAEQFALSILADLPDDGFVLGSDEIWHWLRT